MIKRKYGELNTYLLDKDEYFDIKVDFLNFK